MMMMMMMMKYLLKKIRLSRSESKIMSNRENLLFST